ncbi:DUF4349 domain-containing protein [bacterium]|nr:DUF4349 domain-containing protein [bacterium]
MESAIRNAYLVSIALFALLSMGCGGGKESNQFELHSGMDKKSGTSSEGLAASVSSYDRDFRQPPKTPASPQQTPGDITLAAIPGEGFNIERWFSPAAFAAETGRGDEYLIRSGKLTVEIEDYEVAAEKVREVAEIYSGYVADSKMEKYGDGSRQGWITIRVPGTYFDLAFNDLKLIGEVVDENITTEDVGNEYVSSVSRLKNLLAQQETLQGMLADAREVQRTRGLGEAYSILLETQKRLGEVTYEMQRVEDRVAQLADKINHSTITVHLSERAVLQSEEFSWGIGATVDAANKELVLGLRGMSQGFVHFAITAPVWLIPLAVIGLILWAFYRRLRPHLKDAFKAPAGGTSKGPDS